MFYASRSMVVRTLNHIFHAFAPFLQSVALCYFLLGNSARFVWDRLKYIVVFADSPILDTGLTDPIVIFYCVVIFHNYITAFNPNYCIGQPFPTYLFQRALGLCFFCRGHPSAWILQSFFGLSAMLAYSICRIILSIKAISSSVRPYFLYNISSVHGWEKSWRGTNW